MHMAYHTPPLKKVDNMSFNMYIDVGVMINVYHHHLREEGGGVFVKELHDSHVGRACNDCNGSTICIYVA